MPHGLSAPPFGAPGLTPKETQATRNFLAQDHFVLEQGFWIDDASVDVDNTPTNKLQPGLAMVRVEAGANKNKYVPLDHADAPVTNDIKQTAILSYYVNLLDSTGVVEDKDAAGVIGGVVKLGQILFSGADANRQAAWKAVLPLVHFKEDPIP